MFQAENFHFFFRFIIPVFAMILSYLELEDLYSNFG